MTQDAQHGTRFLEQLLRLTVATPEIMAAYVGGPLAVGAADPFAEVELWLVAPETFCGQLAGWVATLGETAFAGPSEDRFRLVTPDGLAVAIAVVDGPGAVPAEGVRTLFDRYGLGEPTGEFGSGPALTAEWVGQAAAAFWLDLYRAAASLGREQPLAAHGGLERCRVHLLDLYRLALTPGKPGTGWATADLLPSRQLLEGLREWLVCPLELQAQWKCAHRLATTYERLVLPLTERLGLSYPWALRSLAFARLDEVKPGRRPAGEPGVPTPEPPPAEEPPKAAPGPARFKVKARRPAE